jgi:hypothetical protein
MTGAADRFLTPAEASARRVLLLASLDAPDTDDMSTWITDGVVLNDWQRRQVRRATRAEWDTALWLTRLDLDLERAEVERLQREYIRVRNGLPADDEDDE